MSQYLHFYIKNGENFLPIGTWNRSSRVYEIFRGAPYEKIRALKTSDLAEAREQVKENLGYAAGAEKRAKDEIEFLRSCAMGAEERLDRYHELVEYLDELRKNREEEERVLQLINFFQDIIDEAADAEKWSDNPLNLRADSYLFYGIECYQPTIKDLEE